MKIMMRQRLKRLAIAIALTSLVGFGLWSGYSYRQYQQLVGYIASEARNSIEMGRQCRDPNEPDFQKPILCGSMKESRETIDRLIPIRASRLEDAYLGLWLALGLPFTSFFLFYVGNWVMYEKLKGSLK
ncbi:hypothetical protein ACQ4WY_11540 [Janthinobacterium sp. LB2P49]|uniref:hypothetical protein n=1 Tax=Janthinobacterium sp. LB2P49 TaxID=3424198 RepID=UPI003F23552C